MRKTKSIDEQVSFVLKQAEPGTPVAEIVRKMESTEQSFYRWKRQFAKMISHSDIVIRPLEPRIERNLSFVYLTGKLRSALLIAFRDFS